MPFITGTYGWMDDTGNWLTEVECEFECEYLIEDDGIYTDCRFNDISCAPAIKLSPGGAVDELENVYDVDYYEDDDVEDLLLENFSFKSKAKSIDEIDENGLVEEAKQVITAIRNYGI